jgi:glycosyltransferase involved in cell wall biosynthesis
LTSTTNIDRSAARTAATEARPAVSVILPTYQRAHLVGDAIGSVLRQTFPNFELLVVDDGSTDATAAVVASSSDDRVRFLPLEHRGRSQARNEGLARARGELVVFLDSDDRVDPTWIEELCRPFADASVGCVCCGAHIVTERPEIGMHAEEILEPACLSAVCSDQIGLFLAGTFAVRRRVIEAAGGYDPHLSFGENSELAIRLIQQCEANGLTIAAVHKPLLRIQNRRTFGGTEEFRDRLESAEFFLERHGRRYREKCATSYAHQRAVGGVNAYRLGLTRRAIRHLALAVAAEPLQPLHWARLALGLLPPIARRFWTRQKKTLVGT